MKPSDARNGLQLSLLDRLLEDGAVRPSLARIRQSVRRDLEWLLNARRSWLPLQAFGSELDQSVLGYGLPDFTVMELSTEDGRQWLCEEVRRTIRRFEPRLARVDVVMRDTDTPMDRYLRLRIEGILLVEPVPQPVAFDSELEPVNLSVTLRECA
ncbi:type VI secretion system baseplate subunit TssE [Halovibrio salipaludis]|nr:type VI secretion system baseplate subunit TssE [Halovibrio salipaludis]